MQYIVCDIDGTLAKIGNRLKYIQQEPKDYRAFYEACDEDKVITPIANLIYDLSKHYNIIFCTGRKEFVREKTWKWINDHVLDIYDCECHLLMRSANDNRPDTEVKPELLHKFMEENDLSKLDINCIFEDRSSMVSKWRGLDFTCIQVNDGNF